MISAERLELITHMVLKHNYASILYTHENVVLSEGFAYLKLLSNSCRFNDIGFHRCNTKSNYLIPFYHTLVCFCFECIKNIGVCHFNAERLSNRIVSIIQNEM